MSEVQSKFNRRLEERLPTQFPGFLLKAGLLAPIKVVDIAPKGIGFFSSERLNPGDIVEIELTRNEVKTFNPFVLEIEICNRFVHEQMDRYGARIIKHPEIYLEFLPSKKPYRSKFASTFAGLG